ncbi:uncharacterized protein V1518DRAFT_188165 [Limtongia smithiae]|uniref:uncharacterized protein n=1 Tax=Limtongia smithiae TaxID=1125753 RepID=UPI0034CD3B74
MLLPLKIVLSQVSIIVPLLSFDILLLALVRDVFEIGALTPIFLRDYLLFSWYFTQLSPFYLLKDRTRQSTANNMKIDGTAAATFIVLERYHRISYRNLRILKMRWPQLHKYGIRYREVAAYGRDLKTMDGDDTAR